MKRIALILFLLSFNYFGSKAQSLFGINTQVILPSGELKEDSPGFFAAGFNAEYSATIRQSPISLGGRLSFNRYGSEVREGWHGPDLGEIRHRRHNEFARLTSFIRFMPDCDINLFPYVDFIGGVNLVYTRSILRESALDEPFDRFNDLRDAAFTYGLGAGIEIPLDEAVFLDLSFRSLKGGKIDYLTPSSTYYDHQSDAYILQTRNSRFDTFTLNLGVKVIID